MGYTPHARKVWIDIGQGQVECHTDYGTHPVGDVDHVRITLQHIGDAILSVLQITQALQEASRLSDAFDEPINLLDAALAAARYEQERLEQDVGDTMDKEGLG